MAHESMSGSRSDGRSVSQLIAVVAFLTLGYLVYLIVRACSRVGAQPGTDPPRRRAAIRRSSRAPGLAGDHETWALFIGVIIAILAMFFLFRDGKQLLGVVTRAIPLSPAITSSWVGNIDGMIRSNIAASLVAASIQGTIGGLAFAWFALPAPVLWGVVMGFFCVFPFIGAWLVWGPAAAALALANRPWDGVLMVIIGLAVVHPVDNLLRPAIVARSTKLNGLLVLIGLLGGVQAFGASGLLLGPVLISIAAGLLTHLPGNEPSVKPWPQPKSM